MPIVKSISAIQALARRHAPLIAAKRQIEELLIGRDVTVDLPTPLPLRASCANSACVRRG
jgi:hypothetical protein